MRYLALGVLVLAIPTVGLCASLPKKFDNPRAGISLRYPRGWSATARSLTGLVSPAQVAAVASFALRQRHPDDNCTPRHALAKVGARGAFIFVMEYSVERKSDFPQRPRRFVLPRKRENFECFPGTFMLRFRDRNRYFQVHIALGRAASATTRQAVVAVLNSLVVKPR